MSKSTAVPRIGKGFVDFITIVPQLFPDYQDGIYFDVLNNRHMVNLHVFDASQPDGFVELNEEQLLKLMAIIGLAIRGAGYDGGNFAKNTVADGLYLFGNNRKVNPFKDWLESLHWDGRERVGRWFVDGIGATLPMLDTATGLKYIKAVTVAWAMGIIGRQYTDTTQADVVPILIGEQRIGKSNFIRMTAAGHDEWYMDSPSDMSNPKEFLEGVWGSVIIELSEATAIRSKDSERTKANISKRKDRLRLSYDRLSSTIARRFAFIATTNLKTPFSDITGNMRYFPIYCFDKPTNMIKKFFEDPTVAKYEAEQFWAEAMVYYQEGMLPSLSDDIKAIAEQVQDYASKHNECVDYLNDYLDSDPEYSKKGAFITRDEIYKILIQSSLTGMQLNQTRDNFIFVWINTKGCDWIEHRVREKDALGNYVRRRGFIRQSDAKFS